jgi:hypothetical protein
MQKVNNTVSVWYNQYGTDKKYFESKGDLNKKMWKDIISNVDFINKEDVKEFEIEEEGEGWVMYGYDGVGVFVVKEGYDIDKCKEEYDSLCD